MYGPARDAPEPEGAVAAFAVEQGRPHDAVVRAASGDRALARQLGGQETAARARMQPEGGDVDQAAPRERAGGGEAGGREVVHALVSLGAAAAQDPHGIHHRVAARQQDMPVGPRREPLEMRLAQLAAGELAPQLARGAPRVARADAHLVAARRERRGGVAADEPRASQHQHSHPLPPSDTYFLIFLS
jgi:hypothetical protein